MSMRTSNVRLNDLLIEIHRSLVQYASESWLWSTDGAGDLRNAVKRLAQRQRSDVEKLAQFLIGRKWRIDFGVYPARFTSLHYVSLEFLYTRLADDQRQIVRDLEHSGGDLLGDAEARIIAQQVAVSQREGLEELLAVRLPGGKAEPVWMK